MPPSRRDASLGESPRHHQGELVSPERVAMPPGPLMHDNVRTRISKRVRPPNRIPEEERLKCADDEVRARNRTRHYIGWSVTAALRGAEDRPVDIWMSEADGQRELCAGRDAEHRGTAGGQRDSETHLYPPA